MAGFGRRNAGNWGRTSEPIPWSRPRAGDERERGRKIAVVVALYLGMIGLFSLTIVSNELTRLSPRDLSPGARFDAAPHRAPVGCPVRMWQVGEFIPAACIDGQKMQGDAARAIALEPVRRRGGRYAGGLRGRAWVRAGDDVLLVAQPWGGSGEILDVIEDRFTAPGGQALAALAPDSADYRQPPADYWARLMAPVLIPATIAILLLIALLWTDKHTPLAPPREVSSDPV